MATKASVKNITDYFNVLSDQKIIRGRIITENENYVLKMQDCDDLFGSKIEVKANRIYYTYSVPCAGPPPDFTVVVTMAESNDKTVHTHVTSVERTFGDRISNYYKLHDAEFVKVEKSELPSEVLAAFKLSDR